jgi:hypothetical protein
MFTVMNSLSKWLPLRGPEFLVTFNIHDVGDKSSASEQNVAKRECRLLQTIEPKRLGSCYSRTEDV